MSRRGSVLQGIEFKGMDYEPHFEAMRIAQQERELQDRKNQQKQQKSDKEAYDLISGLKIDHIGDNTIDVMTDKLLQGLQDELMDMHLKGATTDQLRLTAQRKLPEISNGHTLAKNKLKEINEGVTQLGKNYKNADLIKAKELALKPMIEDIVRFDDKGNAIGYKDVATVPNRNYTDILFDDNTLGQWYKPSGEFMSGIKSLPLTPIQGGSVRRDARGKLIDQTYTGHRSIFDKDVIDKETGKMLGQELKYEDVAIGINEDGTPKTVRAMPVEQFNLAFPTEDAKLDFRIKFNDEMRKRGVDPSKIDPRAKDVLQRQYLYDLFKNTGIHGSSFLPKDIEEQPLPPRVSVRVGGSKSDEATINDVYNEIDTKASWAKEGMGFPLNRLSSTAQGVVIKYANDLVKPEIPLGQADIYVRKEPDGTISIVSAKNNQVIAPIDFKDVNLKVQPGAKEKRGVIEKANQNQLKKFNVIDPTTGKVILSGVDEQSANKAKAKGYKIQ